MLRNDSQISSKKESSTTKTGQVVSFLFGGFAGSVAYNAYHALKDKNEVPASPKPNK